MRVIAITQIWPNSVEPLSSPFNLQQFKGLAARCDLTVLAAVAHVPGLAPAYRFVRDEVTRLEGDATSTHPLFPAVLADALRSAFRETPRPVELDALPPREVIHGIDTRYVRQLYLPKIGVPIAVPLYLASLAPHRALLAEADVILGTWAYPDGCAAILAAHALVRPCVVKVHGSDINVIARRPSARAVLKRVLPTVDAMVSVSAPLSDAIAELGVQRDKIHLVANGVDTSLFAPRDKGEARRALGLPRDAEVVLFVGRLEPQKGITELLEAIPRVRETRPQAHFVLVGDGVARDRVADMVKRGGGTVIAPGARPLSEVARWLTACDVFTLPSWMEGTPNVVLESLASGRPVVATSVGGIPDVLADARSGILVPPRDATALAAGLVDALARVRAGAFDPESVRACGPRSWDESAAALYDVIRAARDAR